MAAASIAVSETPLVLYALRRADDALILGHRLSEWCGHAPMLEEDMALANMGLDLLGQARELYSLRRQGRGQRQRRRQIRLPARRQAVPQSAAGGAAERRFRAHHGAAVLLFGLRRSLLARDDEIGDATLAAIAAKSEKESAYHLRHSSEWIVRLGDGTEESHRRAQAAIDDLWAFTGEMFAADDSERGLIEAGIAVDPAALHAQWLKTVTDVVGEATLVLPKSDWMQQGGRDGRHSEHLGHLLSELQSMQRTFPGATW